MVSPPPVLISERKDGRLVPIPSSSRTQQSLTQAGLPRSSRQCANASRRQAIAEADSPPTPAGRSFARRSHRNLAGRAPVAWERTKAPIVGNGSPLRLRQSVLRLSAAEPGRIVKQ